MTAWQFLLDENIDPAVRQYLDKEGIDTEHVRDTLGQGADDEDDLLPYARSHERIVVTSDVTDFAPLSSDAHAGIVLLYDDTLPAYDVATGLIRLGDTYPDRESFAGREILDDWVYVRTARAVGPTPAPSPRCGGTGSGCHTGNP